MVTVVTPQHAVVSIAADGSVNDSTGIVLTVEIVDGETTHLVGSKSYEEAFTDAEHAAVSAAFGAALSRVMARINATLKPVEEEPAETPA